VTVGVTERVPVGVCDPLQAESALQLVALVDDQVTVALCPNVMVLGDTLIVTVGAAPGADAGVLTISAAAPLPAPPVPVQVSE
jgi:hypothetical protein